jgi:multicomponent Na+:H+ antiporter subunit D
MAAGLSSLRRKWEVDDQVKSLRGLGWEAPVSTLALTLGGLSIAGLPISAGFVWRWVLYRSLAPASPGIVLLLLAATAGVVIGVWRGLSSLLAPPEPAEEENGAEESPKEETLSEGKLMVGIVMLGMIACVAVGLFPQYLAPLATRLAETYTFFAP